MRGIAIAACIACALVFILPARADTPPPRRAFPAKPIHIARQTVTRLLVCANTDTGMICVWVKLKPIHSPRFP